MRENELHVVRNHKDTVFRMLYKDRRNLLELYNALNGTDYEDVGQLEICTLENAIYMSFKNDVSFLLDSEMNLYEHQSSFNPNMPLRDLMYIAKQLEKYASDKTVYSNRLIKIPMPHFVVFYNGTDEQPERSVLKLSDAFEKKTESPELECKVVMLNINPGKNRELMKKCKILREYCQFVECIRENAAKMEITEAVDSAVTDCIRNGILAEFLASQRAEVVAMSIFEYNEEEEIKKIRADEYSYGEEIGMKKGMKKGVEKGKVMGKAEAVVDLLENLGEIPDELRNRILLENDFDVLRKWIREAAKAETVKEFLERTGMMLRE